MNTRDTMNGNRLIAEYCIYIGQYGKALDIPNGNTRDIESVPLNDSDLILMKYRTSWSWLMPVVKRILHNSYCLEGVKMMKRVQDALITCDIDKTWLSVVAFMEWENSDKNLK